MNVHYSKKIQNKYWDKSSSTLFVRLYEWYLHQKSSAELNLKLPFCLCGSGWSNQFRKMIINYYPIS